MRCLIMTILLSVLLMTGCAMDQEERKLALEVNVATMSEYFCVATQLTLIVDELLVYNPDDETLKYIKAKVKESKVSVSQLAEKLSEMVKSSNLDEAIKQKMLETLDVVILLGMDNVKIFSVPQGE